MSNHQVSIVSMTNCAFAIGDSSQVTVGDETYINGRVVSETEITAVIGSDDDAESSLWPRRSRS